MSINTDKLNEFMGRAVGDMGAAISAALVFVGDRLGLYKAMAGAGPMSSSELAKKTNTAERYIREWLNNQAASGYVTYDPKTQRYTLPEEQAFALANDESPAMLQGGFQVVYSIFADASKIEQAFKTGKGIDWGDHHPCLFEGTERFFRANYIGNLIASWIPALDGVEAKLKRGAKVADVGCGHGASTILLAQAYPEAQITGFDYHAPSIEAARKTGKSAGLGDRVKFEVAKSTDFPGKDYDLVCFFDCLHDMGDPIGAAKHVKTTLKKDGSWMIVEPFASDKPEENHNPVGRVFYGASAGICVPASIAHQGPALGAQAGEAKLREVVTAGGFTKFRRATQTPFNLILEAKL